MKKLYTFSLSLFFALFSITWAQIPAGYYDRAEGKSGAELKTALHEIISTNEELFFGATGILQWWNGFFRQTDWHPPTETHPEGFFWCMYSFERDTNHRPQFHEREHAMPRSWWVIGTGDNRDWGIANGDLHNIFPTNRDANGPKSNFPLGEVNMSATGAWTNGVVRVGPSAVAMYTRSHVFEPPDRYKGDFARVYMYMVTRYEHFADTRRWTSRGIESMIANNRFPTFTPYGIYIVMKWHRNDPVSQKEIDRNNAVHRIQGNRNPFIDHPELAEYLWGNRAGYAWFSDRTNVPTVVTTEFGIFSGTGSAIEIAVSHRSDEPVHYEIYSITGQKLRSGRLTDSNESNNRFTLSTANLNSGIYILVVYSVSQRHTARFFVGGRGN